MAFILSSKDGSAGMRQENFQPPGTHAIHEKTRTNSGFTGSIR